MSSSISGPRDPAPTSGPPTSGLYEGRLRHRRFSPTAHRIEHRLYMAWLELDGLEDLLQRCRLASTSGWAPVTYRRRDYFGNRERALAQTVRELVDEKTGRRPEGPVYLLTHLRTWGLSFNPVSFYYCYGAAEPSKAPPLEAIVAEVRNTPWDERHCYVLAKPEERRGAVATYRLRKDFHVSPFMPMDVDYTWKLNHPGSGGEEDRLFVHMENRRRGDRFFDATLDLRRRACFCDRALLSALLRHPVMPLRVLVWIYGHALALWLKRVPFFTHPASSTVKSEMPVRAAGQSPRPGDAAAPATRPPDRSSSHDPLQ